MKLYFGDAVPRFVFFILIVAAAMARFSAPAAVDFNREVQPILSENCFKCHGPDEAARKAKLRLDTKEGALGARGAEEGPAIVRGNAEKSPLFQRIISSDPDEVMPPPK